MPATPTSSSAGDPRLVPWWRSFVFRLVFALVAITAGLIAVAVVWLHRAEAHDVERTMGRQLRAIAATTAPFIAADDVEAIRGDGDVGGPEFQRVRAVLAQVRQVNDLQEDQVYILRPGEEEFDFVVMLQERTFVGDRYTPPAHIGALYRRVLARAGAEHSRIYEDEHGSFISGVAPIVDGSGRTVALLQVDRGLDELLAELERRTAMLTGGGALLILLVLLAGFIAHRHLRAKTLRLLAGTHAIAREDYDHRVGAMGDDELGAVAASLNDVIGRLRERFAMLKFLPEHTKQMIRAHDRGVTLDVSRRVRVVVLESDIRGFSSLSEHMSPEETIAMLNTYIRAQAEHVAEGEGSIDKYMGDAVLAVFEGEGMERRALVCALAIQRRVAQMNEEGAFSVPVRVGVGLSVGEVVMGNMGSEERMEHTVIGAVVNLAARLCSAAGAGEIVTSAELYEAAGMDAGADASMESIRVKGFEDPVPCARIVAV